MWKILHHDMQYGLASMLLKISQLSYREYTTTKSPGISGWLVGCRFESSCQLVGPETIGGALSVGGFLSDPSPYLREFPRKLRKTPNG